jgi:hypothetical protein
VGEQQKQEPGKKHDAGKPRTELLPWPALFEVAKVLTKGAEQYGDWNWRKGMSYSRLIGAALRHIGAWADGKNIDPQWGLSHLAHAACCVLFLLTYELDQCPGNNFDDRFSYGKDYVDKVWTCSSCGDWWPGSPPEDYLCDRCRRSMAK